MVVIADSSPLIFLARLRQLSLLGDLYGEVLIPSAVHWETVLQDPSRPGAADIAGAAWIAVQPPNDILAVKLLRQQIGPGESEAIVLALQQKAALLLIDDAKARRIAEAYGISTVGTIGVLIQGKRRGSLQLCGEDSGE